LTGIAVDIAHAIATVLARGCGAAVQNTVAQRAAVPVTALTAEAAVLSDAGSAVATRILLTAVFADFTEFSEVTERAKARTIVAALAVIEAWVWHAGARADALSVTRVRADSTRVPDTRGIGQSPLRLFDGRRLLLVALACAAAPNYAAQR